MKAIKSRPPQSVSPSVARECFLATLRRLSLAAVAVLPYGRAACGIAGGEGHSRKPPIPPECRAHLSSRHPSCPFLALVTAASSGLKHIQRTSSCSSRLKGTKYSQVRRSWATSSPQECRNSDEIIWSLPTAPPAV